MTPQLNAIKLGLEALKYLTEYSQQHGVMPAALTTARAAINKAERTTHD